MRAFDAPRRPLCRECEAEGVAGCSYCQPEPDECPRCMGTGSEAGTSDPCQACCGAGVV